MDNLGVASEEVSDSIITEEMRHSHQDKETRGVPGARLVYDVRIWRPRRDALGARHGSR